MIDQLSYTHNLSSCEIKAWKKKKKIQAWTRFEPMTSAIPVQCSTNCELVTLIELRISQILDFIYQMITIFIFDENKQFLTYLEVAVDGRFSLRSHLAGEIWKQNNHRPFLDLCMWRNHMGCD